MFVADLFQIPTTAASRLQSVTRTHTLSLTQSQTHTRYVVCARCGYSNGAVLCQCFSQPFLLIAGTRLCPSMAAAAPADSADSGRTQ